MGNVYSRKGTKKLWIKYLQHGRAIRESTGTNNIVKARRILRDREGDVAKGVPVNPNVGKITFHEAAADLLNDLLDEPKENARRCRAANQKASRTVLRESSSDHDYDE